MVEQTIISNAVTDEEGEIMLKDPEFQQEIRQYVLAVAVLKDLL